ncbi:MAG: 2'-5' RNA ligase family protein [Actinomycetota bacterium]
MVPLTGSAANPVTGTPVDLDLLFGRWATAGAHGAEGVPLHVTLLTPFIDSARLATGVFDQLQAVLAAWSPFECTLEVIRMFDGSPRIAWLEPEPSQPFTDMTLALMDAFPGYLPYGGQFGSEITPHVTIAVERDPETFQAALAAVRADLPIRARASEFSVYHLEGKRWELNATRPLGVTPSRTHTESTEGGS